MKTSKYFAQLDLGDGCTYTMPLLRHKRSCHDASTNQEETDANSDGPTACMAPVQAYLSNREFCTRHVDSYLISDRLRKEVYQDFAGRIFRTGLGQKSM